MLCTSVSCRLPLVSRVDNFAPAMRISSSLSRLNPNLLVPSLPWWVNTLPSEADKTGLKDSSPRRSTVYHAHLDNTVCARVCVRQRYVFMVPCCLVCVLSLSLFSFLSHSWTDTTTHKACFTRFCKLTSKRHSQKSRFPNIVAAE